MQTEHRASSFAPASPIAGKVPSQAAIERGSGQPYHFLDDFLQLMFQPKNALRASGKTDKVAHSATQFQCLPLSKLRPTAGYDLPNPTVPPPVHTESAAVEVMTDLRRVTAVTIGRLSSVNEANETMIARGVRALFVADDRYRLWGIVTATDVLGEKPVHIAQQLGIPHNEVMVRDIMTPVDRLEVIELRHVLKARVGDVVATLKRSGRQHALVVDCSGDAAAGRQQMVRGIFSITQIARQLGITTHTPEIGHTFAEIVEAIRL